MSRRPWQLAIVCSLVTVVAVVCAGAPASSSSSQGSQRPARLAPQSAITKFPLGLPLNIGTSLTPAGHKVYFEMVNGKGQTRLARIGQQGNVSSVLVDGFGYSFQAPLKTSDGAIWMPTDTSTAQTDGVDLVGLDPSTLKTKTYTTSLTPQGLWPSVADNNGRAWAQAYVIDKGIALIGGGLNKSKVVVRTSVGPISSQADDYTNNPLIVGPDGHVWLLGGDGFSGNLRIVSVGPNGILNDVAPKRLSVAVLSMVNGGGRVWTIAGRHGGHLVAVGVDSKGAVTRVETGLLNECFADVAKPLVDGNGGLWVTGSDVSCGGKSELLVAKVAMKPATAETTDTGLGILGDAISSLVTVSGGVLVAGVNTAGKLNFARVTSSVKKIPTQLLPWVDGGQARYPIISDKANGAWSQAVNAGGNLVVVHVSGNTATPIKTGLAPVSRQLRLGPDDSLWTQGLHDGKLVLVKVSPTGTVTKYPTGLAPSEFALNPVSDGKGHFWFTGMNASNDNLVLVRVANS